MFGRISFSVRRSSLALTLLVAAAFGQDYRGKVQGIVTDTSQAVVPGAQLMLINTLTAVSAAKETSASGQYLFDLVDPGTYKLTCEREGFSKFVQESFTVQVRGDVTVNVILRAGR